MLCSQETSRTRTQRAVVPWHLAGGAASFVRHATNATHIALSIALIFMLASVPSPLSDRVPVLHGDLHVARARGGCGEVERRYLRLCTRLRVGSHA